MDITNTATKILACTVVFTGGIYNAAAQTPIAQDPVVRVTSAIVKLFEQHRVVMLGEMHESIQEHVLLNKLVAAPGFSERVNDIVVEACNSLYQDTMDRYISGENVPAEQVVAAPAVALPEESENFGRANFLAGMQLQTCECHAGTRLKGRARQWMRVMFNVSVVL